MSDLFCSATLGLVGVLLTLSFVVGESCFSASSEQEERNIATKNRKAHKFDHFINCIFCFRVPT
jgi:hypothetical protein